MVAYYIALLLGLATYNILQNPLYQESFAITSQFASEHRHMGSIRIAYVSSETCLRCFCMVVYCIIANIAGLY